MLAPTRSRLGRRASPVLLAAALLALTTITAAAAGPHLALSAKSARAGAHLRITLTGYAANTVEPVFLACKSQSNPQYGSWIWHGKTDGHGALTIQEVVPTPFGALKRPYTSCRLYATDSSGKYTVSLPFRILSPKK